MGEVKNVTSSSPQVRAYAFSGTPSSPWAATDCMTASLQVLLINLKNATSTVELPFPDRDYVVWSLEPPSDGVYSEKVLLNGVQLPLVVDVSKSDPKAFLGDIP